MRRVLFALTAMSLLTSPAWADRPVTDEERARLTALLKAEGCTGGEMEFDDGKFEVDDARCADGRKWDFEFDSAFKLIKKDQDD